MPAIQYHLGVVPKLEKKEREKNDWYIKFLCNVNHDKLYKLKKKRMITVFSSQMECSIDSYTLTNSLGRNISNFYVHKQALTPTLKNDTVSYIHVQYTADIYTNLSLSIYI